MRVVICDLHGGEISEEADIRYIDFYKDDGKDGTKPVHSTLEVCAICVEKVHEAIQGIKKALAVKGAPDGT